MDSNFFRCLVRELGPAVRNRLVNKVFMPGTGVWSFELWNGRSTEYLLFRADAACASLFLSGLKPANPSQPPAEAMWLRKRLKNRKLLEPAWDWANRKLAWALNPGEGRWLVLDMRTGPSLQDDLDDGFGVDPEWLPADASFDDTPDLHRRYPQYSPALRGRLDQLDASGRRSLLERLERGDCDSFWVHGDGRPLPWPPAGEDAVATRYAAAAEAAAAAGGPMVFGGAERVAAGDSAADAKARMKRLRKTMRRMDKEEAGLHERMQKGDHASLLQSQLYRLDAGARMNRVALDDFQGGEIVLQLDPELTVAENMAKLFKDAGRARRGLQTLEERRAAAREELEALSAGRATPPPKQQPQKQSSKKQPARDRWKNLDVARFRSSDGFLILRGKNSKANHKLLSQAASPFDLWFHAQDGPGSHAVLKLDHPGQSVPRRTVEEAAALAGLKSWQSTEDKGRVMCARVADVRKVKGLAQGQVVVDAVLESLLVDLNPALEEQLRIR